MYDGWYTLVDGKPVPDPFLHQANYRDNHDDWIVAQSQYKDGEIKVSTVFLFLDHRFKKDRGEPILWETMIFGGSQSDYCERYTSREEAEEGHKKACAFVEASIEPYE